MAKKKAAVKKTVKKAVKKAARKPVATVTGSQLDQDTMVRHFGRWAKARPKVTLQTLHDQLTKLVDEAERLAGSEPDWVDLGVENAKRKQWEEFFNETGASGEMQEYLATFTTIDSYDVVGENLIGDIDTVEMMIEEFGGDYQVSKFKRLK